MLKRILALVCISLLLMSLFTVAVSAERRTEFPFYLAGEVYGFSRIGSISVKDFYITSVYELPGGEVKRAEYQYVFEGISGGNFGIDIYCYNEQGFLIDVIDFKNVGYIDVHKDTAMIEFAARKAAATSQTFLYLNYINVYHKDGSVKGIPDLMFPEYLKNGWSKEQWVTMFAFENGLFERTIAVVPGEVEAYKKVGWYTVEDVENAEMMYASPTKIMRVPQDQVWLYKTLGWNTFTTMYSYKEGMFYEKTMAMEEEVEAYRQKGLYTIEDVKNSVFMYVQNESGDFEKGRAVPLNQVDSYKQAGWFTLDEVWDNLYNGRFGELTELVNEYKAEKQYEQIFRLVDSELKNFWGTEFEEKLYAYRTEAMDLWREESGAMGVVHHMIQNRGAKKPQLLISFRNVSYKKIVAYKVAFTCHNIFGDVIKTKDYYFDDDVLVDVGEVVAGSWELENVEGLYGVKDIRVIEVLYADGTKWYGK